MKKHLKKEIPFKSVYEKHPRKKKTFRMGILSTGYVKTTHLGKDTSIRNMKDTPVRDRHIQTGLMKNTSELERHID